jgi:hypothetical protein
MFALPVLARGSGGRIGLLGRFASHDGPPSTTLGQAGCSVCVPGWLLPRQEYLLVRGRLITRVGHVSHQPRASTWVSSLKRRAAIDREKSHDLGLPELPPSASCVPVIHLLEYRKGEVMLHTCRTGHEHRRTACCSGGGHRPAAGFGRTGQQSRASRNPQHRHPDRVPYR